jgi:hypothetical protein
MPFKKGQSGNPKGKPRGVSSPGSGRTSEEFKVLCRDLANSKEAMEFLGALVAGDPIVEKVLDAPDGEPTQLLVSASPETRVKAWIALSDRGYGKANQYIEHSGHIATESEDEKKARRESVINRMQELMRENK